MTFDFLTYLEEGHLHGGGKVREIMLTFREKCELGCSSVIEA